LVALPALERPAPLTGVPSIAQIHLGSRQVQLNYDWILRHDLADCVEALLAHEVGHHVRYPGTLAVEARMRLIEKSLIPIPGYSLTNLFTDLMINEHLGSTLREPLVKLYRALVPASALQRDPAFAFYLGVYEELWELPPGTLLGSATADFERAHPGFRGDARLLCERLFHLEPNIYTQFLYFVSVLSRYLKPPELEKPEPQNPSPCHADEPNPDDWAEALRPNGPEKAAVQKALREGWLAETDADKLTGKTSLARRIAGLPGMQTGDANAVPEIMGAFYRREAERYLFHPPPQLLLGEAVVPTSLEDWEWSEPVKDIDWLQSLLRGGPELGAIQPVKRTRIAETEGYEAPLWHPLMEIYLDVSGSMPDPRLTLNAMTLAALILATAALRKGGSARALLYSQDTVAYWNWCRSETELSRFLMHYIGGGTNFPFARLAVSLEECADRKPTRVIITDADFHKNFAEEKSARRILAQAVRSSGPFVLLLHRVASESARPYRELGAEVIEIADLEDFPKMAAKLAEALFADERNNWNQFCSTTPS
jgi:hypothetical protein